MLDIVSLGEALIDFFAVKSGVSLNDVSEFRRVAGGAPANVAVGAARMGLKTSFIGRVGDDEFGHFLKNTLAENKVDVSQMQFDSRVRTGLAFVALPTPNTREFLFYRNPSADMMLDSKEFNKTFIKDTKVFHFGSITLISEPGRTSTYDAINLAKSNGAVISYDPNLRLNLWPCAEEAKNKIIEAIPLADIIKVNDEEIFFITGEKDIKKGIQKLISKGPKLCIVTMGAKGCIYSTSKYTGLMPAFKVRTVDATGCGDSFVAGLLAGVAERGLDCLIGDQRKIVYVLKFASAAAAITSTRKGVIASLPCRADVEKFLSKL